MGMNGEENWRSGRKVEQEGRGEEARKRERGREEKRKGWINGKEEGRVR